MQFVPSTTSIIRFSVALILSLGVVPHLKINYVQISRRQARTWTCTRYSWKTTLNLFVKQIQNTIQNCTIALYALPIIAESKRNLNCHFVGWFFIALAGAQLFPERKCFYYVQEEKPFFLFSSIWCCTILNLHYAHIKWMDMSPVVAQWNWGEMVALNSALFWSRASYNFFWSLLPHPSNHYRVLATAKCNTINRRD